MTSSTLLTVPLAVLCVVTSSGAQAPMAMPMPMPVHVAASRDSVSMMATVLVTRVSPAIANGARTTALVTQPMLSLRSARLKSRLQLAGMLDFERWTMPDGEPVAGIWGEGFIDRRHPHTVVHELMVTANGARRRLRGSVSAGRGFVPFGTDDPMVRPFTKFPANHHLAQVMERVQLVAVVRPVPQLALEGALFNGDEPASPTSAPEWKRFGDSRAARITIWPIASLEAQASVAAVRSPEFIRPDGLDQLKQNVSARWTPADRHLQYALVELARTGERYQGRSIIAYHSALAEGAWQRSVWSLALRGEQTTRPEDERLLDPFRTPRPPNHLLVQGVTRWRIATVQVGRELLFIPRTASLLFVEVAHAASSPRLRPVLLDPRDISGSDAAWHVTLGLRVSLGAMPARVGRYGAAAGGPLTDHMPGMDTSTMHSTTHRLRR